MLAAAERVGACFAELAPAVGFLQKSGAGQNFEKSISATGMGFLQKPAAGEKIEKSFAVTAGRFLKNLWADENSRK